jgi:hypothetical protein
VKRGSIGCLLACTALMILGCGPGGPATVPVTGKVTKGGAGVAMVVVTLVDPANPNNSSSGESDATGAFTLSYGTQGKKGAVPGKYKVILTGGGTAMTPGTADNKPSGYGTTGKVNAAPVLDTPYDKKWGNLETSPMEVEVKSGMAPLDIKID